MKAIDVVCGVLFKDKKVLVAQRSEKMTLPLKWEFPGGKMNPNESEEQCLIRELYEELNIIIKPQKRLIPNLHNYGAFVINLIPYVADCQDGSLSLIEHKDVKFVAKNELLALDMAPADIQIIDQILELWDSE